MLARKSFLIASPTEPGNGFEMHSPAFYAGCTFGGVLSYGLTHMAVIPLDLVKCNMQEVKMKPFSIRSNGYNHRCLPGFSACGGSFMERRKKMNAETPVAV